MGRRPSIGEKRARAIRLICALYRSHDWCVGVVGQQFPKGVDLLSKLAPIYGKTLIFGNEGVAEHDVSIQKPKGFSKQDLRRAEYKFPNPQFRNLPPRYRTLSTYCRTPFGPSSEGAKYLRGQSRYPYLVSRRSTPIIAPSHSSDRLDGRLNPGWANPFLVHTDEPRR